MTLDTIVSMAWKSKALIHQPALKHLCEMAISAPDGIGVEIGVYRGGSLLAWSLARAGRGDAIGVDDWSYPDPPNLREVAVRTLDAAGAVYTLYDMTSAEAAKVISRPLAFVHIDGDHRYQAARQDIELWTPKLMAGGVIAFHDYGRSREDIQVKQAVDEWQAVEPWFCLGEVLTTIGYRKP